MEIDYEKMYNNLNELLQDICKFLNTDKLRDLSPKDKKLADALIGRCKVQLQEISKIQQTPTNDEYVDMNSKKVSVVEEEERKSPNIYSSVDDNVQVQPTLIEEAVVYPYKDLPAREASQEVKYGCISMRRKFLLGFEKMKKFYATIHKNWLLVYCNEKDMKPVMTFNLKNYEAKSVSERSTTFELMSTLVDQKVYSFMAITPKDMLQWVVKINNCHDNVVLQAKGLSLYENTTNEDDVEEHYDSVISPTTYPSKEPQEEEEEEENIYLELDVVTSNQNNNTLSPKKAPEKNNDIRPALPGRRPMRNLTSIPVAPPIVKSLPPPQEESDDDGSMVSYDDIEIVNDHPKQPEDATKFPEQIVRKCSQDTISDEDEDCTYEAFVDVVKTIHTQEPEAKPSDKPNNDEDQKPVQGQKPLEEVPAPPISPTVKDKPPVARKPAISARIASIKKQFKDFSQ